MISVLLSLHVSCALISIALFIWRGFMMWVRRPLTHRLLRRTLPDSVDTLFLATGITMAFLLDISPLEVDWLAAKIGGLLLYVALGIVALKYGHVMWLKRSCFVASLCVFSYVIAVAHTMNPLPWV